MRDESLSVKYLPNEAVESETFDKNEKFFDGQSLRFYIDIRGKTVQVTIEMPQRLEDNIAYMVTPRDEREEHKEKIIDILHTRASMEIIDIKEELRLLLYNPEQNFKLHEFSWKMIGKNGYIHQNEMIEEMYRASKVDLDRLDKWYFETGENLEKLTDMRLCADKYVETGSLKKSCITGPYLHANTLGELIDKAIEVYGAMILPEEPQGPAILVK